MKVLILEPYNTASHARWAREWSERSVHAIDICSMSDQHWKWRMHGAAVTFAREVAAKKPDIVVCTDMMDVAALRGILHQMNIRVPVITYFHESQTNYPVSELDSDKEARRDHHYTFLNFTSALSSDEVVFNSSYHLTSFFDVISSLLRRMPDHRITAELEEIRRKSHVLYPGLDDALFDLPRPERDGESPVVLWNHRWEYDKNPDDFFEVLIRLRKDGIPFRIAVCGEKFDRSPKAFDHGFEMLRECIIHWGYAPSQEAYRALLSQADLLPVTSHQEFFGYSVTEAIAAGVYPLMPDRLVYPEHLQDRDIFYRNSADELYERLKSVMQSRSFEKKDFRSEMEKYRWSSLISSYDSLLSKYEE